MARILMVDNPIDWIMLANAHRYSLKYPGSQIQIITNCNLANMAPGEEIFIIGHADVNGVGVDAAGNVIYSGVQLADQLHANQMRADQRKITLPGSCEVAAGNFVGVIYELRQQLTRHNYRNVEVKGAVGLAIAGWPTKRVVDPAQRNAYIAAENATMANNAALITVANHAIAALPANPNAAQLAQVALIVFNAVQPFYNQLIVNAAAHLLPAGEGYKVSR